jgi:hypothetical protein
MNPREAEILENARNRKIAIQNLQRDNLEAESIWRDKQQKSYGNLVSITEAVPLSKIITDEQQARSQDEFLQRQHATANVGTLADQANTEYIIDRLNYEQMRWLNDNWEGIIRNIKKKSSRMDKNIFVNMIIHESANGIPYDDTFAGAPTDAMTQRAGLRAGEADAVAQRLAYQAQIEEDQRAREQQAGLDLNDQRERDREAQQSARIAQFTAKSKKNLVGNKLKAFIAAKRAAIPVPTTPPRAVSPTLSAAAQAGITASVLAAKIQAIADAKLKNSAGGNAVGPNILTPVVSTVGNAVLAGGAPASPRASSPVTTMVLSPMVPQPPLVRQGSHVITLKDIESIMLIKELRPEEEADYASEIANIKNETSTLNKTQIIRQTQKILSPHEFNNITDKLKQITGSKYLKDQIYRDIFFLAKVDKLRQPRAGGKGLRNKRVIRGKGYTKNAHPKIQPRRHYINDSYYVDLNKLDDNILCVKYAQNDSVLPHLKPQSITGKTKEIITDILNNKYDNRIFKLLSPEEKRDVKKFCKCVRIDISINDPEEDEYQRQFEIVRGEYMSGNDSPEIKATLKRYVLEALRDNKIAKSDGYNLLYSLSL